MQPVCDPQGVTSWQRSTLSVDVWSTIVRLEARGEDVEALAAQPFAEVVSFLDDVDRWFSTFRDDTPVHLLRTGAVDESPGAGRRVS